MSTPILDIRNFKKRFNELEVLHGLSLTAHSGDVISMVGASGSGKSTFLRCINLLEMPEEGEIFLNGDQIRLRMPNLEMMDRMKLQKHLGSETRVSKTAVWLTLADGTNDWKVTLVQVLEKMADYVRGEPVPA